MRLNGKRTNKVTVVNYVPHFKIRTKKLIDLTQIVLAKLGYRNTFLTLVFVPDAVIKRLNQRYLKHAWVTDVLAFPFSNFEGAPKVAGTRSFLGEVIISPKRAQIYSKEFQVSAQDELIRYVCHGILHLKGYTDTSKHAQKAMRHAEDRLIQAFSTRVKGII